MTMFNFDQLHRGPKTPKKAFPFLNPQLASEILIQASYGLQTLSKLWPQYSTQELKQLIRQAKELTQ